MNPFQPTPPEVPFAPVDITTPQIPSADFVAIGKDIQTGWALGEAASKTITSWLDFIPELVGLVLGSILKLILRAVAYIMTLIFQVFSQGGAGTEQVIASALAGMFEIPVSPSSFIDVQNQQGRQVVLTQIVSQIFSKIAAGGVPQSGGGFAISDAGAANTLKVTATVGVEGWLSGFLVEALSLGQLETFAELKEIMERTLGLGHMANQAIRPLARMVARDPFQRFLNLQYRPALLDIHTAIREFMRGMIDQQTLDSILGQYGYSASQQTALVNLQKVHLSVGQLRNLIDHGNMTDTEAHAALAAQGYDQATAQAALQIPLNDHTDALQRRFVGVAMQAYSKGKIDLPTFLTYLNGKGLPAYEVTLLQTIATLEANLNEPLISLTQGTQLLDEGLWTVTQYSDLLRKHGYTLTDSNDLELLALAKMTDKQKAAAAKAAKTGTTPQTPAQIAAAAAAKAAAAAAAAEAKGVSVGAYEALVRDGIKTVSDYTTFLLDKGVSQGNAAALTSELQLKLQRAAAKGTVTPTNPPAPHLAHLSLSQLESAVKGGHLTMANFQTDLVGLGYTTSDAALLVVMLQDDIAAAAAKAAALGTAKNTAVVKRVNLAALEKAARLGIIQVSDFSTELAARGFPPTDVSLLVAELNAQITADKAAAAAKGTTTTTAATKTLTIDQLGRAVRAGLASIGEYAAALKAANYDAGSIAQLTGLLQLQMDNDAHTLAASGQAAAKTAARGISLSQLERAVKLGLVPIANYTSTLQAAGVDSTDAALLTTALQAQVKTTTATVAKVPTISQMLATRGLSLADLESKTIKGVLSLQQFQQQLLDAGVGNVDIQNLSMLVTEEIANLQSQAALKAAAGQTAKARGLNLSQFEKAVVEGVKTLQEYHDFVVSLNYSNADADTLTNVVFLSKAYQKLLSSTTPGA
jgi:hypothetical protein